MNVVNSITCSYQHEKITDKQLSIQWKIIDWHEVEKFVNRIQIRIAKAIVQNKYNLVKRLQYLLTHSFYAKVLAVKRITESKGKRTPGVDGITWTTEADKMIAVYQLTTHKYKCNR